MKTLVKNYNKSEIFKRAWKFRRESNNTISLSICLKKSWHIAKNGKNTETFTQIYNKYYKQILYFVNGRVNNMTNAEDITADIFMKFNRLYTNNSYDVKKTKINTYLHIIAKSAIIDFYRKSKENKTVNVDSFVDESGNDMFQFVDNSTNDNDVEKNELNTAIMNAIVDLKPNYKQIAELFFIKELNYNEISETLNIPIGTVKGMINRTRTKLQASLKDVRIKTNAI
jgi:RNA polymerase sigma factor (sigma-70 family)